MELYVKQDVLILADCVNHYRKMVRDSFNLEAMAYYSSPGLTLDAALKFSGVSLELIQDPSIYMFIESSVRGGVAVASCHHAKANNPYVREYDSSKPTSWIFYQDVTSLYGFCLSQKLPISSFKWETYNKDKLLEIVNNFDYKTSDYGFLVEVDLDIDPSLHSYFYDFPPVISKLEVSEELLSPWSKMLLGDQKHKSNIKLAPNLYNKRLLYITNITAQ